VLIPEHIPNIMEKVVVAAQQFFKKKHGSIDSVFKSCHNPNVAPLTIYNMSPLTISNRQQH
jgi:hypothetical protein